MTITNIQKRNGEIVPFDKSKIEIAISKAFSAMTGDINSNISRDIANNVISDLESFYQDGMVPSVEKVQDTVELQIMKAGYLEIAKHYIVYRFEHQKIREEKKEKVLEQIEEGQLFIIKTNGKKEKFNINKISKTLDEVCDGYKDIKIEKEEILNQIKLEIFENMSSAQLYKILIMNVRAKIEEHPIYSKIATKLLLNKLYKDVLGKKEKDINLNERAMEHFPKYITTMVENKKFDERMLEFDLKELAKEMDHSRDMMFEYMGLEICISRYLIEDIDSKKQLETPQMFWMRIAMGTAVNEDKTKKMEVAKSFYKILSNFYYTPGGRTLYQAGTIKAQISNCFINEVQDDLGNIFKMYGDNSQLLKWSGGVGTSWTKVRATGSRVKSVEIESNGVIPYLKISNDINVAIMRSGKRRAASVVYLETWHLDIEDYIELRKNTGDERRRTHDMNTANWIPDLFMKRVRSDEDWTLFSPNDVPELNDLYGKAFETKYNEYEKSAKDGKIKLYKTIKAKDLWKKMLAQLYETGHPWITFKDPANIRNPQDHCGVIHSSNLCTEIILNTSETETAVCTLGSINIEKFITDKREIDKELLEYVLEYSVRMLDNVVDINYYPTEDSKRSNLTHRPVGLGIRGYHDALYKMNIVFDSQEAINFSDYMMENVAYYCIYGSSKLAKERGAYKSYKGSKWDRNILPQDSVDLLEKERGEKINVNRDSKLDWKPVREHIKQYGMRNSNTMAIAPTASTANLVGCIPTIEPIYKNIYVKSNKEGEFTVINKYLVRDLEELKLWDKGMLKKIKSSGGSVQEIREIPQELRNKYKEVFEIDQKWLIMAAAVRQKWVDQSQSINVFFSGTSGKDLSDIYMAAWEMGLKTTYYLRTLGASQVEKSTVSEASTHIRDNNIKNNMSNNSVSMVENATTIINNINNTAVPSPENIVPEIKQYNIHKADNGEECEGCSA